MDVRRFFCEKAKLSNRTHTMPDAVSSWRVHSNWVSDPKSTLWSCLASAGHCLLWFGGVTPQTLKGATSRPNQEITISDLLLSSSSVVYWCKLWFWGFMPVLYNSTLLSSVAAQAWLREKKSKRKWLHLCTQTLLFLGLLDSVSKYTFSYSVGFFFFIDLF